MSVKSRLIGWVSAADEALGEARPRFGYGPAVSLGWVPGLWLGIAVLGTVALGLAVWFFSHRPGFTWVTIYLAAKSVKWIVLCGTMVTVAVSKWLLPRLRQARAGQ